MNHCDRSPWKKLMVSSDKLGCLFAMVISSELLHSNHSLRPRANNHREQAPHFIILYDSYKFIFDHYCMSFVVQFPTSLYRGRLGMQGTLVKIGTGYAWNDSHIVGQEMPGTLFDWD